MTTTTSARAAISAITANARTKEFGLKSGIRGPRWYWRLPHQVPHSRSKLLRGGRRIVGARDAPRSRDQDRRRPALCEGRTEILRPPALRPDAGDQEDRVRHQPPEPFQVLRGGGADDGPHAGQARLS